MQCNPYRAFLRIHDSPGWLNGNPTGGFTMIVSSSGRVELHKMLLQLPCWRRCLCSMTMLKIWWRDEYDINGVNLLLFYQYLSSWLIRKTVQLLAISGLMSESHFTVRQHIEEMSLGEPLDLSCLYYCTDIYSHDFILKMLSYSSL